MAFDYCETLMWVLSTGGPPVEYTLELIYEKDQEATCDHAWYHELRHHKQVTTGIIAGDRDIFDKDKDMLYNLAEDKGVTCWSRGNTWKKVPFYVEPITDPPCTDSEIDADVYGGQPHSGRSAENWANPGPQWEE